MDLHEWGTIYFWISILFFSILALHLFTHWKWTPSLVKGRPWDRSGYRVGLGLVVVIAIIFLSIAPLISPIESSTGSMFNEEDLGASEKHELRGSMTLKEMKKLTNVPVEYIIESFPH